MLEKKLEGSFLSQEQKEKKEVMEKFMGLLEKKPEYKYHDGSLGVSHNEDIIELVWPGEENKDPEGIKLNQAGEWGSNYAHSQSYYYEADPTTMQIAKIVAEKGAPTKIGYTRIDVNDWVGQEDRVVNERQSAEFSFSEVESEVLKVARALAPEYANLSLEQIGNTLREKEAQERHQEVVERFKGILEKKPEYKYHDGSLGVSRREDEVVLVFKDKENEEETTVRLDQEGQSGSNYAYSETQYYEADSTAHQLAAIISEKGTPKRVIYTCSDFNDWPGSTYKNEQISGVMNFSEVESEVLKAARALAPEYANLSLEQIGNTLREKEAQESK